MKPEKINYKEALRTARSFGLKPNQRELVIAVTRANNLIRPLSPEDKQKMLSSKQQREDFAETIRTGWYQPMEYLCCWYQEEARQIEADTRAAMQLYEDAYGNY